MSKRHCFDLALLILWLLHFCNHPLGWDVWYEYLIGDLALHFFLHKNDFSDEIQERPAQIYGYGDIDFEGTLILSLFRYVIVVHFAR